MSISQVELTSHDGLDLRAYDSGESGDPRVTVMWFHGTPNIGSPPEPLFALADELGVRWIGYDRPGYGGSTRRPGRDIASAAGDVAAVADALGVESFGVMSHSGGGPHALACAALLGDRVAAAAVISSLAPRGAEGLDWFAGMSPTGQASLQAAIEGLDAKERFEMSGAGDGDPGFTPGDMAALGGAWKWLLQVVGPAMEHGPGGLIDDDLAYVGPWGFEVAEVSIPVLLVHGGADALVPASHSGWLAQNLPDAELWTRQGDGHLSVLAAAPDALQWLARRISR